MYSSNTVYLLHHAVLREYKEMTNLRVVFDASCKGVNNISRGYDLHIGPELQLDLRHIPMQRNPPDGEASTSAVQQLERTPSSWEYLEDDIVLIGVPQVPSN
ncbi:unnamed protein product [Pieris macdunnoughi]|nr:unnamed protein product [Pieris macdunnoughi]